MMTVGDGQSQQSLVELDDSTLVASQDEPVQIQGKLSDLAVVDVATGCRHATCMTQDGELYSWGFNFYEQLGLGDSDKDFDEPTRCHINEGKVKKLSCGYFHSAALIQL